jgi:hypothetical protein
MIKCPVCKEEIQDDAIKCKHCGEILNKNAYAGTSASPSAPAAEVKIPIGKMMHLMRKTLVALLRRRVAVPLMFLVVLCIAFNAVRLNSGFKCVCVLVDGQPLGRCYQFALWPLRFHLHTYPHFCGFGGTGDLQWDWGTRMTILYHAPVFGVSLAPSKHEQEDHDAKDRILALPVTALGLFIAFLIFWRPVFRLIQRLLPEGCSDRVLTLRFDLKHLGLGEKIILGSALAALLSLFLPWVAMGILSSSGWNQQGYLFCLLFVYPVIGVFNVKRLNRIAGIICGVLALVISIWYIADKHYEIMGVTGNASASGLYLFAASTIGLIVGALKYKQQHHR